MERHTSKISAKQAKKDKGKDKQNSKVRNQQPSVSQPVDGASLKERLQALYNTINQQTALAHQKEVALTFKLNNVQEVVDTLNECARIYNGVVTSLRACLQFTCFFSNRQSLEQDIFKATDLYNNKAQKCSRDASEWPGKVAAQRNAVYEEIACLKLQALKFESEGSLRKALHAYKRLKFIHTKLIEGGEPCNEELASIDSTLANLESKIDQRRISHDAQLPVEHFDENQSIAKKHFFSSDNKTNTHSQVPPIEGKEGELYLHQFYRHLVQRQMPAKELTVRVYENKQMVHEESIEIHLSPTSWQHYLVCDELLVVPKTDLSRKYGLELRLAQIYDPNMPFTLVVYEKGSDADYEFAFYLDGEHLYQVNFTLPPPFQLEVLRKPPSPPLMLQLPVAESVSLDFSGWSQKLVLPSYDILDEFVKEMKGDPLALTQFVYNDIEWVDPYVLRHDNAFQAPGISGNPLRTFLDRQGSVWEQCALLVYLLKKAGYQAEYVEGLCTLPAQYVEKLLFTHLPGEHTVDLYYPGVLFHDGKVSHTLYPWMKHTEVLDGYEIFSKMPDAYGNAERWLSRYLSNDENILKHIGPDGDDTVGVLFKRFVAEKLRSQGLCLEDVGTHRITQKKQYNNWEAFPRPKIKGNLNVIADLALKRDLFSQMKVVIYSASNALKRTETSWMDVCKYSCGTFFVHFSDDLQQLFFTYPEKENTLSLPIDQTDETLHLEVLHRARVGNRELNQKRVFSIARGTAAALCLQPGYTSREMSEYFAAQFQNKIDAKERLHALLAFVGTAYYEKCSHAMKDLATLCKINPPTYFSVGLAKLSPDPLAPSELRYPQVDMQNFHFIFDFQKHPFCEMVSAARAYKILTNADISSNEHQIIKEVFQDEYAISTVKLLQIAQQNHERKGLTGLGFLTFTRKSFADADKDPKAAALVYFPYLKDLDLAKVKTLASQQWNALRMHFALSDGLFSYAYMTPGPISSEDSCGLMAPSYTGVGTLIHSELSLASYISDGMRIMNGGFGSRLKYNPLSTILPSQGALISNGVQYSFMPAQLGIFNSASSNIARSTSKSNESSSTTLPAYWFLNQEMPEQWRSDVREGHKSTWDTVADPVDVVSGAFYVDEVDITLPGVFPLEIRRNYSSQNSLPGLLGFGWKLSLNPFLHEEEDKLFAAEQDGTMIVYRYDQAKDRWIILAEDNPGLKNFNKKGIGGLANPFHSYIEKNNDSYILIGNDGSKREFRGGLLLSWTDHVGNTLSFSYRENLLVRIDSANGAFVRFKYNSAKKISEVYTKDGRRVSYTYDFHGNLSTARLPNTAEVTYEYDNQHRIIRETKPHGRVIENIYADNKVVEQRSPVGSNQSMVITATFCYDKDSTTVRDANGACSLYKIFNQQIYKIVDPEGHQTLQSWFIDEHTYFDAEQACVLEWHTPGAYKHSLKSSKDKRGLVTDYTYDANGNSISIEVSGEDLTGDGTQVLQKSYTYNAKNLCEQENVLNTKTVYTYQNYLPLKIERFVDNAPVNWVEFAYNQQGQVEKENSNGMITLWEYDHRHFPKRKTQKTATEDSDVVTEFLYNDQGQCVDVITSDAIEHCEYDIMGNKCAAKISLKTGEVLSQTSCGYDLNNQLLWTQGDDPHDTMFLDYNAAGLLKATRKNLSQWKDSQVVASAIAYTIYEYDACGRLIEKTDPLGNVIYCHYDLLGRLSAMIQNGLTKSFSYEAGGLIASETSPSGATTYRHYTTNGLVKSELLADGSENCYVYDLFGRVVKKIGNGIASLYEYHDATNEEVLIQDDTKEVKRRDSHGNLVSLVDAAGYVWTKTYDGLNRVKTEVTPNGDTTIWNYHDNDVSCALASGERIIQRFEAGALKESKTLGPDGSVLAQSFLHKSKGMTQEANGAVITTTWQNTYGNPLKIQCGDQETTYQYDVCGNCIASIDGEGNVTQQSYDACNRLVRKTLPDGAIITYEYDADSNLVAYHMPGNLSWKATYDTMGRKTAEWQESSNKKTQQWKYTYENSRIARAIDPAQRQYLYQYDTHARLISQIIGKYARLYTYDPRGLLTEIVEKGDHTSKIERTYDESARLISETISLNGKIIQHTDQAWTPSTRTLQIGSHRRTYSYQGGRPSSLSCDHLYLDYTYDINGTLINKKTPYSNVKRLYSNAKLPQQLEVELLGDYYQETCKWSATGKMLSYESSYPENHNLACDYTSRGFLKTTQNNQYAFDFNQPGRGIRTSSEEIATKSLDEFGRIVEEVSNKEIFTTSYNEMGQVVIQDKKQMKWDPWGRLISVIDENYEWTAAYDALGRRLQTTYTPYNHYYLFSLKGSSITTTSLYDPESEFQEIGVVSKNQTIWKLYGPETCDALIDDHGDAVVLHHDIRNNLVAIVSTEGVTWHKDYPTPYGPRGPPTNNLQLSTYALSLSWQNQKTDPTGLIWLGARYYDPLCGRFLSPDPISYPVCLDLYVYANGDPINNYDPDGRFSSPVYNTIASTSARSKYPGLFCGDAIEAACSPNNRSRAFDLSNEYTKELPDKLLITFLNGMGNNFEDALKNARHLSKLTGGCNVKGVYGASHGFFGDLVTVSLAEKHIDSGRIGLLGALWHEHLTKYPDGYILHYTHSRGSLDTKNLLLIFDEEMRKRIIIIGLAPADYIFRETCKRVVHYRASMSRDLIPYRDREGAARERDTIITLKSHKDAPWHDHDFISPTYEKTISQEFERFIEDYGK